MELSNKIAAIVTGGASGLGEAAVRALAKAGARVAIFDVNAERGEALARETGGMFAKVDVTSEMSVTEGFRRAREAHGTARVLVTCAGAVNAYRTASRAKDGTTKHFPVEQFDRLIQLNLVGTFRCIAHAAEAMLTLDVLPSGERGAIVATASVAASDGQIGQAAYAASKAGVSGMMLPIARDLAREGIRVNAIQPGLFDTPLMAALPDETRKSLGAQAPFPSRLGDPAEYASLALEMIRNPYFNAANVRLDGAIRMGPQ